MSGRSWRHGNRAAKKEAQAFEAGRRAGLEEAARLCTSYSGTVMKPNSLGDELRALASAPPPPGTAPPRPVLPVRAKRHLSGQELKDAMERLNPRPSAEDYENGAAPAAVPAKDTPPHSPFHERDECEECDAYFGRAASCAIPPDRHPRLSAGFRWVEHAATWCRAENPAGEAAIWEPSESPLERCKCGEYELKSWWSARVGNYRRHSREECQPPAPQDTPGGTGTAPKGGES